jgi:sec-independent protein translocase protein TatA
MGNIGATEIVIIVFILILLFGGKKIPELMKGIGDGIKQFKKGLKGDKEEEENKK